MIEQSLLLRLSSPSLADDTTSRLRQEYQANQMLFQAQPALVQQYLGVQAAALADAVIQALPQAHFTLPENVALFQNSEACADCCKCATCKPQAKYWRLAGTVNSSNLRTALCQRFSELERSPDQALSISAMLVRYAIAVHMIYHVLPAGKSVAYAVRRMMTSPTGPWKVIPMRNLPFMDV